MAGALLANDFRHFISAPILFIVVFSLLSWPAELRYPERLKAKNPDIYIPPLMGNPKPKQQRFTMRSGILTSISSRQCSAISGRTLPERTVFDLQSASLYAPASYATAFIPQCSPSNNCYSLT